MTSMAENGSAHPGLPARQRLLTGLPVQERRLEVAGISTMVLEGGEGPPLVLLHGPGEFAARWFRVIPGLARHFRVVAPDLPGHGESETPDGELDEARVMQWVSELIERTCPEPPILLGHLLGGAIAARFAIENRGRIRSLILVDSFGLHPFRPSPLFALALIGFLARPSEGSYGRFMRQCLVDPGRVEGELGDRWEALREYSLDRARAPRVKAAMKTLMQRVGVPAISKDALGRIDVPTTLIWGQRDRALPVKIAHAASTRYGWPLHVIEQAADDPPMEQPDSLVRAILNAV